ncbi:NAL12 protein, partial [Atractosteus spatula]|nr:NAL12 protein [Atractosteus spatula]
MWECELTERCCEDLASGLQSQHSSLRELDLNENNLGDSGVKLLSAALRNPNCKLTTLRMERCKLSERCCEDLASALQSQHSSLRELDLSHNNLGDSGVKLLSAALRNPNCKLTTLNELGLQYLSVCISLIFESLLNLGCSLYGVCMFSPCLCGASVSYNSLQTFWMLGCRLTERCCEDLASALQSQHSNLKELDLRDNSLGDSGVKLLSAALRNPNCKLTILR